jgi:ArsR family transcriptional regulator|tara:strand:+ start:706 stop:1041 length:336 start_codon:yes stop_codon:yes gene_type:complete
MLYFLLLQKIIWMNKSNIDIQKLELAANKLRAISHPMRIAIMELLSKGNKLSVTDIHNALEIEQATASHHLSILKNNNVLVSQREGKKMYYALRNIALADILECVNRCNEN